MRGTQHPTFGRVALDLCFQPCRVIRVETILESIMAKGQQKTTREKKKPKAKAEAVAKQESSYKQNFKK